MKKIVDIFNLFHGIKLTEEQGWHFMSILKQVRFFNAETFHKDSIVDGAAYLALLGECKMKNIPPPTLPEFNDLDKAIQHMHDLLHDPLY